jgi:transposase
MLEGVAPLDVSTGRQLRHRLYRRRNGQLNRALHQIAITQARLHEPARSFIERRKAQGKSYRKTFRCLKRHLVRVVFKLLEAMALSTPPRPSTSMSTVDLT